LLPCLKAGPTAPAFHGLKLAHHLLLITALHHFHHFLQRIEILINSHLGNYKMAFPCGTRNPIVTHNGTQKRAHFERINRDDRKDFATSGSHGVMIESPGLDCMKVG
jgi:hypothetical protein